MALWPWNIFRKTLYIANAGSAALGVPLTTKLSLVRARIKSEAHADPTSQAQLLRLFLPTSIAAWLLLLAAWRHYSDAERLRALESKPGGAVLLDLLGWRVVAHLGPYQIPNLVHAQLYEEPLRLLRQSLLLDYERARALGRLEQLSQRRLAAAAFRPPPGAADVQSYGCASMQALEPLLLEAFMPSKDVNEFAANSTSTHQEAVARVIFDVVAATPPEDRSVPACILHGLVLAQGPPWGAGPQGEELRATLLCQLLRAPANCQNAASLPEVCHYLEQPGMKRKEDTLWPIKSYLLSGETPDLIRRGARLVNRQCPGAVEVPPRHARDTPSLEIKRDLRNAWTTVLVTGGWAAFHSFPGVVNLQAVWTMARACAYALAGMGVLEGLWRMEERVIQSTWYFEERRLMLTCSAGMSLLNCVAFAWAFRCSIAVPFIFCRVVKDELLDAYRRFEV